MKKLLTILLASVMALSVTACSSTETPASSTASEGGDTSSTAAESTPEETTDAAFSATMVTDVGGVNDQSFNQSAWEGLQAAQANLGINVSYVESKQEADYGPNLDRLVDEGHNIIWGVGFMLEAAIADASLKNPNQLYALIDSVVTDTPENTISVLFRPQEPSFLVGYIAGRTTETDRVGFIGGIAGETIGQFEYGFRAGVAHAAAELGKEITVDVQYADSFSDAAKGKSIALKMYSDGCDIIMHAAGNVGTGLIEAAVETDNWAIGVDRDQSYLAPDHVLTSAMKLVGNAMELVTTDVYNGENLGGQTVSYGIAEGAAGVAPTSDKNVAADVLEATKAIEQLIVDGTITPPDTQETLDAFIAAQ